VSQNLALVLGLQGKYDEAKVAAAQELSADKAADNVDYVRRMVKLEPKATQAVTADRTKPGPKSTTPESGDAEAASPWAPQVAAKAAR
jgi:hypothetical protein